MAVFGVIFLINCSSGTSHRVVVAYIWTTGLRPEGLLIFGGCLYLGIVFQLNFPSCFQSFSVFSGPGGCLNLGVAYIWVSSPASPKGCLYLGVAYSEGLLIFGGV